MTGTTKLESLTDDFKSYLQTSKELLQLQITERIAVTSARIIQYLIIGIAVLFILLFLSVSLGIYLSYVFESYLYGFLSVTGIYIIITGILIIANKALILKPIINSIVFKISNNT
ncbi:phage holin family protein [Paucihalobacter sp.]|uniref:phage holin family protein n=1 Tax=Paucihalobacter sp. TaxID=2850405 RepID=UPI002FE2A219